MSHKKHRDQDHRHGKLLRTVPPQATELPPRTILFHFHIFKNGGSSLDAALRNTLGTAWHEIEGKDPDDSMPWPVADAFLSAHPEIKALSSHTARLPLPASQRYNFIPLFLIRHPLDRIFSIFHHEKRSQSRSANPVLEVAKTGTLKDFIQQTLANYPAIVCDAQTSLLPRGGVYYTRPSGLDLDQAKAIIAKALAPGVVERMDQFLLMLESELATLLPNVDLACPDENRNLTRQPSLLARLREIRSALPPSLWRELRERNRLDLELWRFTYRLARTKFSQMPEAPKRLVNFRQRKARSQPPADLPWTGERLVASAKGDFVGEHLHRYALAMEFASQGDILDVACGEGYGSAFLAKVARSVIGVDCDAPTVAHAAAKYRAKNLRFAEGRAEKLPLHTHSVDLVVSFETLEHLEDHDAMMKEIKRVLRPGGQLLISTPDCKPYRKTSGQLNPFHLHELDRPGFTRLLEKYFKYVNVSYQRSVNGSWIAPIDAKPSSSAEYSGGIEQVTKIESGADAPYLIAFASDLAVPALPSSLFNSREKVLLQTQALTEERDRERKAFAELTKAFTERTSWAKSLEKDLTTAQGHFEKLAKEHTERTTWAKSLEAELKKSQTALANQTKLIEERTSWAKSLEAELNTEVQNNKHQRDESTHTQDGLKDEIIKFGMANDKQGQDLIDIRSSYIDLAQLLPDNVKDETRSILERYKTTLVNLHRDLAVKNAEVHAAMGINIGSQLRAEIAESNALSLTTALKDAQLHLDGLLLHTDVLQQRSNALAEAKQAAEQQLALSIAEAQATKQELKRYESRLICSLAARAATANSPTLPRP